MRVVVAGGRNFDNYGLLRLECIDIFKQLKAEGFDTNKTKVEIISGKANGADTLGERFQKEFSLNLKEFPADWNLLGKSAGYIRNNSMAEYAKQDDELGVLIAFWDGQSRGTMHMIDLAKKHGLRVFVVNY